MLVRRLTWAGLEIQAPPTTLAIDLLTVTPSLSEYAGEPSEPLIAPSATLTAAAITHPHTDHFDIAGLRRALAPGAPVLCPAPLAGEVAKAGFEARGVDVWETVALDGLEVTAVPAVDGFGADQVSWVVSDGDRRLFHGGDTLWHGYWWHIAERSGPIDLAFLPVNGAIVDLDYLPRASGLPAVLTPEQAAAAAHVLGVREAAPIHYGTFHKLPAYISLPDPEAAFVTAAHRRGVPPRVLRPGEQIELA